MRRTWHPALVPVLLAAAGGCARVWERHDAPTARDPGVRGAGYEAAVGPAAGFPAPGGLSGPQPVGVFVRMALAENRTVQAAHHNVLSLRHRVPQVMTLDDPVASNTVFPIPGLAPQYTLMGYNPYNLTLAQQFPWFGTLRLRGEAAEKDVQVALAELAAAQLDTVAAVKKAYLNLDAGLKTAEILAENRTILEDFQAVARERLAAGGTQQDVIRAGTLISELDRTLAENRQAIAQARAALARQVHASPENEFRTVTGPSPHSGGAPGEFERLFRLAVAARPELRGRLEAVARDDKAVALAEKRFYPNVTLGVTYMDMEKTNAATPKSASGVPNLGLFVAFNLPVHRAKYRAGVCEAAERRLADAKLYEAQKDDAASEIQEVMAQVKTQQGVLDLLTLSILPRAKESFALATSDYGKGNVDYATLQSSLRELLQVRLQVTQVEAELGKAFASLERAVGCEINEHPPAPAALGASEPAPEGGD